MHTLTKYSSLVSYLADNATDGAVQYLYPTQLLPT
jgi:hypothetical protein